MSRCCSAAAGACCRSTSTSSSSSTTCAWCWRRRRCTALCADSDRVDRALLEQLAAIWLVPVAERSADTAQVAQWDEEFHCSLVAAAGNAEMARVHRDVTDRIRIIRRLDFTKQARIDATYDEHAKILKAIQRKRGDQAAMLLRAHIETSQAEVRKITLHQVHLARQEGAKSAA